jgi:hypothetical protein
VRLWNLPVLAVRLAQQHGGGQVAVRDGFDIHGLIGVDSVAWYKALRSYCQDFREFDSIGKRKPRVKAIRGDSMSSPPEMWKVELIKTSDH